MCNQMLKMALYKRLAERAKEKQVKFPPQEFIDCVDGSMEELEGLIEHKLNAQKVKRNGL